MKKIVCSIYDTKAEFFSPPFVQNNEVEARRSFDDVANDPKGRIYQHMEDYDLYMLGEFVDNSGELIPIKPKSLGKARKLISRQVEEQLELFKERNKNQKPEILKMEEVKN